MEFQHVHQIIVNIFVAYASWLLYRIYRDVLNMKAEIKEGFEKIDSRFDKFDTKLDRLQTSMHDLDLRMTTIEAEHRIYPWPMVVNEKPEVRRKPGRPKRVLSHKEV